MYGGISVETQADYKIKICILTKYMLNLILYKTYKQYLKLSTVEVEQMLIKDKVNLTTLDNTPLDLELSSGPTLKNHEGSSSGGYAHHVFINAAKELFNQQPENLQWKILR